MYKFFDLLRIVWDIILIIGIIALVAIRFLPIPFGYEPVVCISNSMAPTFYKGDMCYIDTNYDTSTVKKGDIIAFQLKDGSRVTHRVHAFKDDKIITKGDANSDVDISPISREQILGENVLQLHGVGSLFDKFPNKLLISIVAFALIVKFALDTITNMLSKKEGSYEDEEDEKQININN